MDDKVRGKGNEGKGDGRRKTLKDGEKKLIKVHVACQKVYILFPSEGFSYD